MRDFVCYMEKETTFVYHGGNHAVDEDERPLREVNSNRAAKAEKLD